MTGPKNAPITTSHGWRDSAACKDHHDPELWFQVPNHEGGRKSLNVRQQADIDAAKAICAECPVLAECAESADALSSGWGIWAGLTGEERNALKRRDQRAESIARTRPAKAVYVPRQAHVAPVSGVRRAS